MADENGGGSGDGGNGGGNDPGVIKMTQAEFNAKMAEHKRGLQKELSEAKTKAQAFDALHGQVSELLGSGLIDGVEDLAGFREKASETITQFRSDKEKFEADRTRMAKELEKANKIANESKTKYEQATIQRAITDEAAGLVVEGAGREGAIEFFQLKLGQLAEVQEDGNVLVKMDVKDEETGKMVAKKLAVKDALKQMEANPTKYGRYFRSTVNGGTGGETVDGVKRTSEGVVDFSNMSFEKFLELQKKDPGSIAKAVEKMSI